MVKVQRPASCSRVKNGMPRWAASIAAIVHSAVEGVCAPRALHSSTPSGSAPMKRSAPAVRSWTSRSRGSASTKPFSGTPGAPLRGTQTCACSASPEGGPVGGVDGIRAHPRGDRLDGRCDRP